MDWNKFNNLKVLIVDDDQFTRELIRMMLKELKNITIHQARDGLEALGMLNMNEYNILLLDLYMPKMNGKEFIEMLNKNSQLKTSLLTILITTDRLNKVELKDIGVDYYLTKPFDFHNFLNNIYGFLEQEKISNET